MSLTITCKSCGVVLSADTEEALSALGAEHGAGHGHDASRLTKDAVLRRMRHSVARTMHHPPTDRTDST
jgi:hypothetical protein